MSNTRNYLYNTRNLRFEVITLSEVSETDKIYYVHGVSGSEFWIFGFVNALNSNIVSLKAKEAMGMKNGCFVCTLKDYGFDINQIKNSDTLVIRDNVMSNHHKLELETE